MAGWSNHRSDASTRDHTPQERRISAAAHFRLGGNSQQSTPQTDQNNIANLALRPLCIGTSGLGQALQIVRLAGPVGGLPSPWRSSARLIRLFAPRRMSASLTNSRRRSERPANPASNHTPLQPTQPNERTSAPEGSASKCADIADEESSIGHLADRNQALALKLSSDRTHGEFMESDFSWVKATNPVIDDQ